jgi:hypothetical protein
LQVAVDVAVEVTVMVSVIVGAFREMETVEVMVGARGHVLLDMEVTVIGGRVCMTVEGGRHAVGPPGVDKVPVGEGEVVVGEPVADAIKQLHALVRLGPTVVPLDNQGVSISILANWLELNGNLKLAKNHMKRAGNRSEARYYTYIYEGAETDSAKYSEQKWLADEDE